MSSNTTSRDQRNPAEMAEGPDLVPGDQIGRYQLVALLANGGMGQVWTARPIGSGLARPVALKLVRADMSGDENYARMFIDEATVASSFHHPNVCETYELGKHGNRLYMAMEWVAGDSLAGLLRQGDALVPLAYRVAARIIADACAGLHAAHETVGPDGSLLGVVHRDISPPNILVSSQGQSKVSDFGIAKARYQLHERTRTGEVKGKFAYIPPEQLSGGTVDRGADIYAMGCVLYVAATGSRPFGNGGEAIRKILANEYKAPSVVRPEFPEGLEAIIVKALKPVPADRYQTAEDMQIALEEWLMQTGKLVTSSDVAKCVRERLSPEVRARNEALLSQNRVMPAALLSKLASDHESETPTAGSGMVTAPPGLWVGAKKAAGSGAQEVTTDPNFELPTQTDPELHKQRALAAAAPAQTRPSDATELVEFVPHDEPAAPGAAQPARALKRNAAFRRALWLALLIAAALATMWVVTR